MIEETRITKIILHKDTDLEIHWEEPSPAGRIDRWAHRSQDQADQKLYRLLQEMRVHVCALAGWPTDYVKGLKVTAMLLDWKPLLSDNPKSKPWPFITFVVTKTTDEGSFEVKPYAKRYTGTAQMNIEDLCELAVRFIRRERPKPLDLFSVSEDTHINPTPTPDRSGRPARGAAAVGKVHPNQIAGV